MKAMLKPKASMSWSTYHHIKDIRLATFIDIHCNNNLGLLVLGGNPSEAELLAHWDLLFRQYINAIGGVQFASRMEDVKEYDRLRDKVLRANYCLSIMANNNALKAVYSVLNTFGYPIGKVTETNAKDMLLRFEAYLKADIVRLNKLASKFDTESKVSKEITEEDYFNAILDIQEALSIKISPNDDSVLIYALALKKLNAHIERLIKQHEKTKH